MELILYLVIGGVCAVIGYNIARDDKKTEATLVSFFFGILGLLLVAFMWKREEGGEPNG